MKCVIIDDEINSRQLLVTLLSKYCTGIEIGGTANSVQSGLELINKVQPQLIFLDIEMPGGDGFDLLENFKNAPFLTCFVTGYEQYAIKAIKYGAFDYLLKPVDIQELKKTVSKAQTQVSPEIKEDRNLIIYDGHKVWVVKEEQIIHISSEDSYSILYLEDDRKIVTSESLNYYEKLLQKNGFFRSHKSHIINCKAVKSIEPGRTGLIRMTNGSVISLAARRKKDFMDRIKEFLQV